MKEKVQKFIFEKVLKWNEVIYGIEGGKKVWGREANVAYLLDKLLTIWVVPDQKIFNQNDMPNGMFFIASGIMELFIQDWEGEPLKEGEMEEG